MKRVCRLVPPRPDSEALRPLGHRDGKGRHEKVQQSGNMVCMTMTTESLEKHLQAVPTARAFGLTLILAVPLSAPILLRQMGFWQKSGRQPQAKSTQPRS